MDIDHVPPTRTSGQQSKSAPTITDVATSSSSSCPLPPHFAAGALLNLGVQRTAQRPPPEPPRLDPEHAALAAVVAQMRPLWKQARFEVTSAVITPDGASFSNTASMSDSVRVGDMSARAFLTGLADNAPFTKIAECDLITKATGTQYHRVTCVVSITFYCPPALFAPLYEHFAGDHERPPTLFQPTSSLQRLAITLVKNFAAVATAEHYAFCMPIMARVEERLGVPVTSYMDHKLRNAIMAIEALL